MLSSRWLLSEIRRRGTLLPNWGPWFLFPWFFAWTLSSQHLIHLCACHLLRCTRPTIYIKQVLLFTNISPYFSSTEFMTIRNYGLFHIYWLSSPSKMQIAWEQRPCWGSSGKNICYVWGVNNGMLNEWMGFCLTETMWGKSGVLNCDPKVFGDLFIIINAYVNAYIRISKMPST